MSSITLLADKIKSNTEKMNTYFTAQNLPELSFDINRPSTTSLPPDIEAARQGILDATDELHMMTLGPEEYLSNLNYGNLVSIQAIEKFNIATSFPVEGETTFPEIAKNCKMHADDVDRIMRQAMTQHIFHEPRKGVIAHTALSRKIAEDEQIRDWIAFLCRESWRAAPWIVDAMIKWPGAEEKEQSAWALANDAPLGIMPTIVQYPERISRVPGAMQMLGSQLGLQPKFFVEDCDWSGVKTFVDVGGAGGSVCFEVVRKTKDVKCIVQDIPHVIAQANPPTDVASRIEYMVHDMFTPQVVKGADIYFLRWLLHDWSDKYAAEILRNLIPGLKTGARVVINERLLPDFGEESAYQQQQLRTLDLSMKTLANGKERSRDDWLALFAATNANFEIVSFRMPPHAAMAVIEAVWKGEEYGGAAQ